MFCINLGYNIIVGYIWYRYRRK